MTLKVSVLPGDNKNNILLFHQLNYILQAAPHHKNKNPNIMSTCDNVEFLSKISGKCRPGDAL